MLLPIKWLKDYIDLEDIDSRELADGLTLSGSHVESILTLGRGVKNIVVGKILKIDSHPDADKLVVCQIDVGEEVLQIVTGAKNVNEGDHVPVAKVGAVLADGLKIKKGKLRGIESNGMLCSLEELGFSDSVIPKEAKDGIYILTDEYELGRSLIDILGLDDPIIEFEITPNRPDCLSIIGMARETKATFNKELKIKDIKIENEVDNIGDYVRGIKTQGDKCNRYYARVLKDVKIEKSPIWLQSKLMEAGVRPINNIVDITNYVMLEYGQPLHAFDLDQIETKEILVREALEGEVIETLDRQERKLTSEDLVISDGKKPIAIAGVMGGFATEVTEETTSVLIESANFNSKSVRLSAKRFNLRSEASSRFEKEIDPNLSKVAGDRVCELVELIGAGKVVGGSIDIYNNVSEELTIKLRPYKVNERLGIEISEDEMKAYLEGLGLATSKVGDKFEVVIPTFRMDLKAEVDLIEEIGRLYGFHNIASKPLVGTLTRGEKPYHRILEDKTKSILVALGLNEIMTYSFISPKAYDRANFSQDDVRRESIRLLNPLGEDYSIMRRSLIPNMLDVMGRNIAKNVKETFLFEIGNTFIPEELPVVTYPKEEKRLTIGGYGNKDFYGLKDVIETSLERLGIKDLDYKPLVDSPTFHPGRAAVILYKDIEIGIMGEIHPDVNENYGIKERLYLAEIDFTKIVDEAQLQIDYKALPKYPAMERDLALVVGKDVLVGDMEKLMKKHGKGLVESIELFDVYTGDQIEEGMKSVAYSIRYRANDRTLVEEEINKIQDKLISDLEETFDAKLRS